MTVFDVFKEEAYTFLTIKTTYKGNVVESEKELMGIFKSRSGETQSLNMGLRDSASTLHVHPEDYTDFAIENIAGNGVRYGGIEYKITGVTGGKNFDTGEMEHLTFTLQRTSNAS